MFPQAHQTLHGLLQRYTFAVVSRDVVIPDKAREITAEHGLRVTYYHGTAEERLQFTQNYRERPKSVWFNKSARAKPGDFRIAGVVLSSAGPSQNALPNVTDMLVGIAEASVPEPGKPKRSGLHYTMWEMGATPLFELAKALVSKVPVSEASLKPKLRLVGSEGQDELWALARLVLFGNMAAFDPQSQFPMALRSPPAVFVQECAMRLNDDTIWQKYMEACPAVKLALAPPPFIPPPPLPPLPMLQMSALNDLLSSLAGIAPPPPMLQMSALNDLLSSLAGIAPPPPPPPSPQLTELPPPPVPQLSLEAQVQHMIQVETEQFAPHSPEYMPEFI